MENRKSMEKHLQNLWDHKRCSEKIKNMEGKDEESAPPPPPKKKKKKKFQRLGKQKSSNGKQTGDSTVLQVC